MFLNLEEVFVMELDWNTVRMSNMVGPDQTTILLVVWLGSAMFAIVNYSCLSGCLGTLRCSVI